MTDDWLTKQWKKLSLKQLAIVSLTFLMVGIVIKGFSYELCVLHEEQGLSRDTCTTVLSTIMEMVVVLGAVLLGVLMADDWARNKPPKFK